MQYPKEFSQQARARVEVERPRARKQLRQDRDDVPWFRFGPTAKDEENLRRYILRVFLVFAEQACELGAQGRWTVDHIRSEADEFLRRLVIEAYFEEGHDKAGRKLREMVSHWDGSILPETQRELEKMAEWRQFEEALETVATRQAQHSSESVDRPSMTALVRPGADSPASGKEGKPADWNCIEISFLSDERVQIRNGQNTETRNYGEFGFADRRNGKPNRAWLTLRHLAEAGGTVREAAGTGRNWAKVEKQIQEIRKVLRQHFGISADPIPFVEGTGYRTCFKIGCSPSFHT